MREVVENDLGGVVDVASDRGRDALAIATLMSDVVKDAQESIIYAARARQSELETCIAGALRDGIAASARVRESVESSRQVLEGINPVDGWRRF